MTQEGPLISLSPSFNTYSNTQLAQIAARVVKELDNSDDFYEQFNFPNNTQQDSNSDSDSEFEFNLLTNDDTSSKHTSADEIFQNGQIRPVYPVFNRNLIFGYSVSHNEDQNSAKNSDSSNEDRKIRLPLMKLFTEERESALTTSYAGDELAGVPAESYCVWRPKEEMSKKSSSTGSNSKRWRFKDLLYRSHSDGGKDSFVFLTAKKENGNGGGEKRRSYLPYRQDLVGIFGNVKWTE